MYHKYRETRFSETLVGLEMGKPEVIINYNQFTSDRQY